MASRKKKENTAGAAIARKIIEEYQPQNAEDMQDALKDIFGPMFEAMLQGEMDAHLGYASNDHGRKNTTNRRNSYTHKNVKTAYGDIAIDMPVTGKPLLRRRSSPNGPGTSAGSEIKSYPCMQRG